jgi:hypothetical protein
MDSCGQADHSHLFTVRVWVEDLGDGRSEWRGKVQHVISGETRYFRDWTTLIAFLLAMPPGRTGLRETDLTEAAGGVDPFGKATE